MFKVALIDIDNTLWDFASVLYEEILKVNPFIPPPEQWHCWDFWRDYLLPRQFYSIIDKIHLKQDSYGVFSDAREFLEELKILNYKIIIASHRQPESRQATVAWLLKHKLPFDELHLSADKTVLFNCCSIVVDDSPHILERALKNNIVAAGLEFPWNRDNRFRLYKSLSEVKGFIKVISEKNYTEENLLSF